MKKIIFNENDIKEVLSKGRIIMGVDIHVRIVKFDKENEKFKEIKTYHRTKDGKFEMTDPYPGRNSELFDYLSGREDENFPSYPLSCACLPKELISEIKNYKECVGYYSFCEANLADIHLYLKNYPKVLDYDAEWENNKKVYKDNPVKAFIERIESYIDIADEWWYEPLSAYKILYWFDR